MKEAAYQIEVLVGRWAAVDVAAATRTARVAKNIFPVEGGR